MLHNHISYYSTYNTIDFLGEQFKTHLNVNFLISCFLFFMCNKDYFVYTNNKI